MYLHENLLIQIPFADLVFPIKISPSHLVCFIKKRFFKNRYMDFVHNHTIYTGIH